MSDIVGFLLARIAEDEARAVENENSFGYHESYCGWRLHEGPGFDEDGCACGLPARVLAECQAKRAIVAQCGSGLANGGFGESTLAEVTLYHLAAVYADHPDYDEAWRP